MRVEPLGDAAYILRDLDAPAWQVAEALRRSDHPLILDVAASYEAVGVYTAPVAIGSDELDAVVRGLDLSAPGPRRLHEIPVCYEPGDDLEHVAEKLGLSVERVVELHTSCEYTCFAVGFSPGFSYLGWLPEELCGVPRLESPRVRVEPGSVGITGRQTGVYPSATPGGWRILGRTPLVLMDVDDGYFPIEAGDRVRFVSICREEFKSRLRERL